MLSKISKGFIMSVRANQVTLQNTPTHPYTPFKYRGLSALPPEVSPIQTKTKTRLERAPLIKITGKDISDEAPVLIQICVECPPKSSSSSSPRHPS